MHLNCYYSQYKFENYLTPHLHKEIVDDLEMVYPEITFNRIDCRPQNRDSNDKYGYHSLIIENPTNGLYHSVTYMDKIHYMVDGSRNWNIDSLVDIYASAGVHHQDFHYLPSPVFAEPKGLNLIPFTYSVSTREMIAAIISHQCIEKTLPAKPPFRGKLYNFRNFIKDDDRFNVQGGFKEANEYIKEMASNTINMSLNGSGEVCQRDCEILATGTALFREKLTAKFHNPLIPNHHYIAIDCDPIKHIKGEHDYYAAQLDVYYDRWMEVKDDAEFIAEVAANGKEWYDANCTIEANGRIAVEIIDLTKLF